MKNRVSTSLVASALFASGVALAGPTPLPLRSESGTCIYHSSTTQTIETTFGTNATSLPFAGTSTYDFHSPPLTAPTSLTTDDRASGYVVMRNTSRAGANDFTVTARMQYLDYDPATGAEALIVATSESPSALVKQGKTASWSLPKTLLPANRTVPSGHLLHIALTITLVSGNPGGFGQVVYNGVQDATTIGLLPQDNGPATWVFAVPGAMSICLDRLPDGCVHLGCAGIPGKTYLIQATTNLRAPQWTTIGTNCAGAEGLFSFVDSNAPGYPYRFYRASTP